MISRLQKSVDFTLHSSRQNPAGRLLSESANHRPTLCDRVNNNKRSYLHRLHTVMCIGYTQRAVIRVVSKVSFKKASAIFIDRACSYRLCTFVQGAGRMATSSASFPIVVHNGICKAFGDHNKVAKIEGILQGKLTNMSINNRDFA